MAVIKPELKTILDRYGIDPRDGSQIWDCRGTLVLYHKAYEIIAAKESIAFDPPVIVRCDKTEAVIMVAGRMGDRSEWSFGEAVVGQNYHISGKQAAYPWAMAEKRAKDRVIAKLVGLAAYVLSEDEADDLKEGKQAPAGTRRQHVNESSETPTFDTRRFSADGWGAWADEYRRRLSKTPDQGVLEEFVTRNEPDLKALESAMPDRAARLRTDIEQRRHFISQHPTGKVA